MSEIDNTIQNAFSFLENEHVNLAVCAALILYTVVAPQRLPAEAGAVLRNEWFLIVALLLIAVVGRKDTNIALLIGLALVASLIATKSCGCGCGSKSKSVQRSSDSSESQDSDPVAVSSGSDEVYESPSDLGNGIMDLGNDNGQTGEDYATVSNAPSSGDPNAYNGMVETYASA